MLWILLLFILISSPSFKNTLLHIMSIEVYPSNIYIILKDIIIVLRLKSHQYYFQLTLVLKLGTFNNGVYKCFNL